MNFEYVETEELEDELRRRESIKSVIGNANIEDYVEMPNELFSNIFHEIDEKASLADQTVTVGKSKYYFVCVLDEGYETFECQHRSVTYQIVYPNRTDKSYNAFITQRMKRMNSKYFSYLDIQCYRATTKLIPEKTVLAHKRNELSVVRF